MFSRFGKMITLGVIVPLLATTALHSQEQGLTQITSDANTDQFPIWSPNGKSIVFVSFPGGVDPDLWEVSPSGTSLQQLTTGVHGGYGGGLLDPAWLGSSGDLVVLDNVFYWEWDRFTLSANPPLPVNHYAANGSIPDFEQLLFVPGGLGGQWLAVSPDGTTVAWDALTTLTGQCPSHTDLHVAPLNSLTGQDNNTYGQIIASFDLNCSVGNTDAIMGISFSPDGSELAVARLSDPNYYAFDIYIYKLDGTLVRQLTTSGGGPNHITNWRPSWSSDNRIAFSSNSTGRFEIWTINVDGSNLTQVTTGGGDMPTWSPDASEIAFVSSRNGTPQIYSLTAGNAAPAVSISPSSLTFSSQSVGQTSAATPVILTNAGTANLALSTVALSGTNASDFTKASDGCSGATLTPGSSCAVTMTFTPSASGTRSAIILFTDNAKDSPQVVSVSGTGVAPSGTSAISLSSNILNFGFAVVQGNPLPVGGPLTAASMPVTITNMATATAPLTFAADGFAFSGADAGDFTLDSTQSDACSTAVSLAPGSTCTLYIDFSPLGTAARSATLTINSNDPNGSRSVALAGIGMQVFYQFGSLSTPPEPGVPQCFDLVSDSIGQAGAGCSHPPVGDTSTEGYETKAYGCAISSLAAVLNTFSTYSGMTPTTLDTNPPTTIASGNTDPEKGLYSPMGSGDMNWPAIPGFLEQCSVSSDIVRGCSSATAGETLQDYLTQHVSQKVAAGADPDRVILQFCEQRLGPCGAGNVHYATVVGANGSNDWYIFDPGWQTNSTDSPNIYTLSGHEQGFAVTAGGTSQVFQVTGVKTFSAYASTNSFEIQAQSPVELLVTDSEGRQVGETSPGVDVSQVPGSSYARDYPIANDTGGSIEMGDPSGVKTVFISGSASDIYNVTATGIATGAFTLAFRAVASDGSVQEASLSGTASAGSSSSFQIGYSPIPGTPLTITPIPNAPTLVITPSTSAITTAQALSVSVMINGGTGNPMPTGSVTLSGGGYTSQGTVLNSATAEINIPAGSLAVGTDTLTASYTPDAASSSTYRGATGTTTVTVSQAKSTPTLTVLPGSNSITTAQALTVTVTVAGTPTPTGSVTLSSGSYTSAADVLVGGSAAIEIPAGSLAVGADILLATYMPDSGSSSTYISATGSASVTVSQAKTTPTVTVSPSSNSITSAQNLTVTVTVSGTPTPTGSITLASSSYTSARTTLAGGSSAISITSGSLAVGADTLTASYTPDAQSVSLYNDSTGTATVTVSQAANPTFALSNGGNIIVTRGATTGNSSTITILPSGGFTGTVNLSCKVTTSITNPNFPPSCSVPSSVTVSGTDPVSETLTITTTAASSSGVMTSPLNGSFGPAGGFALALLSLLGLPGKKRRKWLLYSVLFCFFSVAVIGCGGGNSGDGGGGSSQSTGTTPGTYTVTVTGTSGSLTQNTTVTLTVN